MVSNFRMKSTHWDPKFKELACRLTKELLKVNYSRTGMFADLWSLAVLRRLHPLSGETMFPSSVNALLDALGLNENVMLGRLLASPTPSDVQCKTVLLSLKHQTTGNMMIPHFQSYLGIPSRFGELNMIHNPNELLNLTSQTTSAPVRLLEHTNILTPLSIFPISIPNLPSGYLNTLVKAPAINSSFSLPDETIRNVLSCNGNTSVSLPFGIQISILQQLLLNSSQFVHRLEHQHRLMLPQTSFMHRPLVSPIVNAGALGVPMTPCSWSASSDCFGPSFILPQNHNPSIDFTNSCCLSPSTSQIPWWQLVLQLLKDSHDEKLNFSPQQTAGSDLIGSMCKFDVLWSRDEVKTRFMCAVSQSTVSIPKVHFTLSINSNGSLKI